MAVAAWRGNTGAVTDPAQWAGGVVPGSSDYVSFATPGTYTVYGDTANSNDAVSRYGFGSYQISAGNVTFDGPFIAQSLTTDQYLNPYVAIVVGGGASATFDAQSSFVIGHGVGSDSLIGETTGSVFVGVGDVAKAAITGSGSATFAGALRADHIEIGEFAPGTAVITGPKANVVANNVYGAGFGVGVGAPGTLTIQNGATASTSGYLNVGVITDSNGGSSSVLITGAGTSFTAEGSGGGVEIGSKSSLQVMDGGTLNPNNWTNVDSNASLTIDDTAILKGGVILKGGTLTAVAHAGAASPTKTTVAGAIGLDDYKVHPSVVRSGPGTALNLTGEVYGTIGNPATLTVGGGYVILSHANNTYSNAGSESSTAGGAYTDLAGGTLELAAPGAAGTGDIRFLPGSNATLVIDAGALPSNAITGFTAGDSIVFAQPVTAATYTAGANGMGTLALNNGTASVGKLTLAGPFAGAAFKVGAAGNGSSISVATPTPAPVPTPTPSPTPTPTPTPSANPSVAAFLAATLPAASYNAAGLAVASAGLGAAAGASGTVASVTSATGSFGPAQPGSTSVAVATAPAAGSTLTLPSGYAGLVAGGSGAVTLSDGGAARAVLVGNGAGDTFNSSGAGTSLVGAGGRNTFNVSGSATVATGDDASTVRAAGAAAVQVTTGTGGSTVVLGGGAGSVRSNGQDTVFGGAGVAMVTAGKGLTAVGGDGRMAFIGGSATSLVFGGKGGVDYTAGSAYDIVLGGSGTLVAQGGAGGGQFWGNSGADVLRASGSTPTVLVANNGGQLFSSGGAGNFLIAGAGDATLDGSKGTGNDVFFGGTGKDTIIAGSGNDLIGTGTGTSTVQLGSGQDTVFAFGTSTVTAGSGNANVVMGGTVTLGIASGAARSFTLFNFVPGTDKISLQGYDGGATANALASQVNGSGQTVLTLSDQTRIQLVGVARADAGFFG